MKKCEKNQSSYIKRYAVNARGIVIPLVTEKTIGLFHDGRGKKRDEKCKLRTIGVEVFRSREDVIN
jgi:hypothetical protein